MKLHVVGQIFGTTGYANHTRGLINALNKICDVKLSTQLFQNWETQVNDAELSMIMKGDDIDRINIIIDLPFNWAPHLCKEKNIGFLVWEGDSIPLSFLEALKDKRIYQVWVPSNHTKQAIENTTNDKEVLDKIRIVPHGYNPEVFKPLNKKTEIFTFLCNKGFRDELDRGGIQYALKAFLQEFKRDEARLIIKMNTAYAMHPSVLSMIVNKYWKETGRTDLMPEIQAIYDTLTPNQMNELYNNCDVFLSPTRCEAFNLPCIEAMACGKPVITTNYGGQTDYVTNQNGRLINYKLEEVKHELLYEGIRWATPDIEHLKTHMKQSMILKSIPDQPTDHTWDKSAEIACNHLKVII